MPYLLVLGAGALLGGGTTWFVSDKVQGLVKWTVIGGVVYVVLKSGVLKKVKV